MSIKYREYRKGNVIGHEVEVRFAWPDGTPFRRRYRAPVSTKAQAMAWGRAREVEILTAGRGGELAKSRRDKPADPPATKEVPTLEEFATRFVDGYARAEKQKASTVATKERILRLHLLPLLGSKRLDEIRNEDVQRLKGALAHRKRKTVNNVINVLSKLLNVAVEWNVIPSRQCTIKLLKVDTPTAPFYEFEDYARVVEGAEKVGLRCLVMVLLGGDAGLRRGEMLALRWSDVDFRRKQLTVARAIWQGVEDVPKGGRGRVVEMTEALASALKAHRHLRSSRVLCHDDGRDADENDVQDWIEQATKRAGLAPTRSLHILRHTFCSHLAMKGAPVKSILELAGHQSLGVTLRYMHLAPSERRAAIGLLDAARRGETLEKVIAGGTA